MVFAPATQSTCYRIVKKIYSASTIGADGDRDGYDDDDDNNEEEGEDDDDDDDDNDEEEGEDDDDESGSSKPQTELQEIITIET